MRGRALVKIAGLLVLVAPLAVSSNTTPLEWHLFRVNGHIIRSAGSLDNYTVVLLSKGNGEWFSPQSCPEYTGTLQPVTLTGANGSFALSAVGCLDRGLGGQGYDTLAVAVVLPDTVLVGTPFRVDTVRPKAIERSGTNGGFICTEHDYIAGYIYDYPPRNISIP